MGAAMGRLTRVVAVLVLALLNLPEAGAGSITVIGNASQTSAGTLTAVASLGGSYAKAVGFTMGPQPYTLDSVTLRLAVQPGSISTLSVSLFGGSAADPSGPALVGFGTPTIPTLAGNVTFLPTAPLVLQANRTYWLEVSGQSDTLNGIVWYASTPGIKPTGVATSLGARFTNQLVSLESLATSSVMNTFQVTGSPLVSPAAVPEPPGLVPAAFSVLAGLLLACWRLWHRGRGRVRETHQSL
jgi:hypothetical protein